MDRRYTRCTFWGMARRLEAASRPVSPYAREGARMSTKGVSESRDWPWCTREYSAWCTPIGSASVLRKSPRVKLQVSAFSTAVALEAAPSQSRVKKEITRVLKGLIMSIEGSLSGEDALFPGTHKRQEEPGAGSAAPAAGRREIPSSSKTTAQWDSNSASKASISSSPNSKCAPGVNFSPCSYSTRNAGAFAINASTSAYCASECAWEGPPPGAVAVAGAVVRGSEESLDSAAAGSMPIMRSKAAISSSSPLIPQYESTEGTEESEGGGAPRREGKAGLESGVWGKA